MRIQEEQPSKDREKNNASKTKKGGKREETPRDLEEKPQEPEKIDPNASKFSPHFIRMSHAAGKQVNVFQSLLSFS